jgi:hypothetical protein
MPTTSATTIARYLVVFSGFAFGFSGCTAFAAQVVGGIVGATVAGGQTPSHDLQQVYYLGVFDPQSQVPSAVYRLTVRGQSSLINYTNFASGWVPAEVADALTGNISFNPETKVVETKGATGVTRFPVGRGLVLFGPEGFRVAPRDHRLVIVMSGDPSKYFEAIESALGEIAANRQLQGADTAKQRAEIEKTLAALAVEQDRLSRAKDELLKSGGAQ